MIHPRRTTPFLIGLSALTLAATGCPNGAPDELPRERPSSKKPAVKPTATTTAPAEGKAAPKPPARAHSPEPKAPTSDAPKAKPPLEPETPRSAAPKAPTPKLRSRWAKLDNGYPVLHVFDARDRLVGIVNKRYARTFGYDERDLLRLHQRADGREEMFMYDRKRKLVLYTGPAGDARYERDAKGRLLKLTTPGGRVWSFKHDGDQVVQEDGATGLIRHDLDAQGRTKRVRDASGRAQIFARGKSAQGRWVDISTAAGETIQQRFNPAGKLVQVKTEGHTIDYRYPTQTSLSITTPRATLTYELLDRGGTEMKTPWGVFARRRDAGGITNQIVAPGRRVFGFARNARGYRTQIDYPGGTTATFGRDFMSRLTKITHPAFRFEAEYDKRHEQVRRVEQGVETRFERDHAGRISKVLRGGKAVRQFGYDRDGNRTLEVDAQGAKRRASFDARFRITRFGAETFTHDAAGRLTSRKHAGGTDTFRYDGFGRLVEVDRADRPAVTYGYDGQNRIVRRTVNKQTTHFVWDGQKLLAEVGPKQRLRLYVDADDLGAPLAYLEGGTLTILHADDRGTVLAYSDVQGKQVARAQFGIFGELDQVPADRPLFYGSHWVDPIARVIPMRARVYEPTLGRFLTPDPSGLDGGFNPYVYGDNDPVDHVDPQGLKSKEAQELELIRAATQGEEWARAKLVEDLTQRAQARAEATARGEEPAPDLVPRGPLERLFDLRHAITSAATNKDVLKKAIEVAPIPQGHKDTLTAILEGAETIKEVAEAKDDIRKVFFPTREERAKRTNSFHRLAALLRAMKRVAKPVPFVGDLVGSMADLVTAGEKNVDTAGDYLNKRDAAVKGFLKPVDQLDPVLLQRAKRHEKKLDQLVLADPEELISGYYEDRLETFAGARLARERKKLAAGLKKIKDADSRDAFRLLRLAQAKTLTEQDVEKARLNMGNRRRLSAPRRAQLGRAVQNAQRSFDALSGIYVPLINTPRKLLDKAGYDLAAKTRAALATARTQPPAPVKTSVPQRDLSGYLAMARKLKTKKQPSSRKWRVAKTKGAKKRLDDMFSR